ncbi:8-oxo-dGTP diphosphatase MutT [Anaerophilus nitritogenes]|uniref:8-oxo-dGTP diphosphatase MutT n=1 Tax=Anaerophilus nitritogenes TaxID=2498136 RepID=UPI00101CBEAF|nr:8-oxo-dGTP diphosphatase MutT [Anaerophilus nitritogenes]
MKKVIAALLVKNDRVLIAKRNKNDKLANKWEFPGGKIEKGETPEECLKREILEELQIHISVGKFFGESIYDYEHGSIQLLAYWARWDCGELKTTVHEEIKWVKVDELDEYDFAPADIPVVCRLKEMDKC